MSLGQQIAERRQKGRNKIHIPEWELDFYCGVLTCADVNQLQRKHKDFLNGNLSVEAMVDLIILKAEDAQGQKLFTLEDKLFLMREPVLVVTRVAGELFGTVLSVEEAEKN